MLRLLERSPCEILDYRYLDTMNNHELRDKIIAYETKPHCDSGESGLGILVEDPENSRCFGFAYHKNLIEQQFDRHKLTYTDTTRIKAAVKAVKAQRKVFMFSTFSEFLKFSVDHCEY